MNTQKWTETNWRRVSQRVAKLQHTIYSESLKDNSHGVRKLQKILVASNSARLLAVRKVTQDNRGKNTPGIDGIKTLTAQKRLNLSKELKIDGKASPIRRVWIPKPGRTEKRPLGIPTIGDRAKQALAKMALEPEWEAKFEANSYGFRPGRSCHDAIEAIYLSINKASQGKYVLDADISKCFDSIDHEALIDKLNTWPKMRMQIRAWLKAGVLNARGVEFPNAGTPQGGVISPLLSNIALHGLENHLKQWIQNCDVKSKTGSNLNTQSKITSLTLVRYADDFVVLHKDLWVVKAAKDRIDLWLSKMGLKLNEAKSRIAHTNKDHLEQKPGFEFLGFSIRKRPVGKYSRGKLALKDKTIIVPARASIKNHLKTIKAKLKTCSGTEVVISTLNPIIRGWCNYYATVMSRRTFERCRRQTYEMLMAWGQRKHASRTRAWVYNTYFLRAPKRKVFAFKRGDEIIRLVYHHAIKIARHVKVQGTRSPYDGNMAYWGYRLQKRMGLSKTVQILLRVQKNACAWCQLPFSTVDILEVDHILPKSQGGKNSLNNLQLLHGHCHDLKHGSKNS